MLAEGLRSWPFCSIYRTKEATKQSRKITNGFKEIRQREYGSFAKCCKQFD